MDTGIPLLRSLTTTLLSEIDDLAEAAHVTRENRAASLSDAVRAFEARLIRAALARTDGNQRRAAALLGTKVTTLHNKIRSHGIDLMKKWEFR